MFSHHLFSCYGFLFDMFHVIIDYSNNVLSYDYIVPILPAAGWALYHYEIWWGFYIVGGLLLLWGLQDLLFDKSRGLFSMSK